MKNVMLLLFVSLSIGLQAQVGFGTSTPDADAILELQASDKALLLPRVALTGTSDITTVPNPVAGMLVYNTATTTTSGTAVQANNIYLFDGIRWKQVVDNARLQSATTGFNESILGYTPVKSADKATVTTAPGGATVTLLGCKTNPANGHVYCAYQLSTGTNFYNTFNLAKQVGGYLVTMTNHDERIWVNTNIVSGGTGYNLNSNIWIGYNKVAEPGNVVEFRWITDEQWKIDWTTSPTSTPENWFNSGEPNNAGGTEGSCHIYGNTPTKYWNDLNGALTQDGGGTQFRHVIIEFNEE